MTREEAINVITNADLSKVEDRVIKAIFYLCTNKALEQEPKWIPVSEGLPEWGEEVLTINNDGNYEINHIIDDERNEWFNDDDIVAWMPLPEPYKAESEVE